MSATASRGFKLTLTSLATIIAILVGIQPYFAMAEKVARNTQDIKELKDNYAKDHDLLTKIAADAATTKDDVAEIKKLLRQH